MQCNDLRVIMRDAASNTRATALPRPTAYWTGFYTLLPGHFELPLLSDLMKFLYPCHLITNKISVNMNKFSFTGKECRIVRRM